MIDRLLDAARGKVDGADALWRREEQTAVSFESGRLKAAGITEEAGLNLRVVAHGRMGVAGTTAAKPDPNELVARAGASAELGELVELAFPTPSPRSLTPIPTFFDRTANASLAELIRMGRLLVERLARPDCQVNVSVQREVADTAVGNTAGARGEYRATGIGVTAEITRIAGDDVLMIYDQYVGADMPGDADLEMLVRSIETRLTAALTIVTPPDGVLPVVFTPAGLAAVVLPLEQAFSGKTVLQGSSPLAGKVGETMFDARLSIFDDPLTPGRPSSRRQGIVEDRQARVEHRLTDFAREGRAPLQHRLSRERLLERQHHGGQPRRRKHDRQHPIGRRHDRQRGGESRLDRAHQHLEIGVARHVGTHVLIVDHQHVVARDAGDLGRHPDARGTVLAACAGGIADGRVRDFALDGDVDLAVRTRQPLDEEATHADQLGERGVGGTVEERGNRG